MNRVLRVSLLALLAVLLFQPAKAQVYISVTFGPPALPIYEQPQCPQEGYLWVPGYWAWDPDFYDYYWVPGTWVLAPQPGYLWTPPWWGWDGGAYFFHEGYWATEVGFYGGIYYGFGYFGHGFEGGRWDHDHFFYNRSVTNINVVNIHNVYNTTVVNNVTVVNRVSYNGGEGGIQVRPTAREQAVLQQRHLPPVTAQTQHVQMARSNLQLRASTNQGRPPVAATVRPTEFSGHEVVPAKEAGGAYHPPANRPAQGASPPMPPHARDLMQHQMPPAQGNSGADLKNQQQQQKLVEKENQEHLKLEQQQEKEHQQAAQEHWDQQKQQQMEQRHQQQTQQMVERHSQEQQHAEPRQNPGRPH